MIDQTLVRSGFDAEILFGERYIKYLLLNSIETGSLPLNITLPVETDDGIKDLVINIYAPTDYERNYVPNSGAEAPADESDESFKVFINGRDDGEPDLLIVVRADFYYDGEEYIDREIEIFTNFNLESDIDDEGNQSNTKLRVELVDLGGLFVTIALATAGILKEEAIEKMRPYFDRSIDTGLVGSDKNVQSVFMRKFNGVGTVPDVIGLYLNLRLKSGPEPDSFFGDRGNPDNAENFLPEEDDIAFGMPGGIYSMISKDAFERMAEETGEGSGVFTHPIHEDPSDKDSPVIGKIKNITITPHSGNLVIDVHGDYRIDFLPDPDFHLFITLKPSVNSDGIIEWDMEYRVDLNPFLEIASLFLLTVLSIIFGPGGMLAGGIIAGLVFGGQELIVEPLLSAAVADKGESLLDASFFDAIPNRLTIESRRWDPFYFTRHQIVAKTDILLITQNGIGFSGKALLDKEHEAVNHVVIRDEERDDTGKIINLWYRVKDHEKAGNDFVNIFPGTDREDFVKAVDPKGETNLYSLSIAQAENRIGEFRLPAYILYVASKVYIAHSQVDGILVIAQREINDNKSDLKNEFKKAAKDRIRDEQEDELREIAIEELEDELDEDPTEEQIDERLDEKINELAEEELKSYVNEELDNDLKQRNEETLRFDLPPEEMADLQSRKLMFLSKFAVIRREGKPYYRDRKDRSTADNLMSLPGYKPDEV
ncbi:MAG TPA: hypothetical protein PKC58_09100 [Ignavibacteria bacterium]|nr:hypothetical protein [Ignavibacteria bacterium]